VGRVRLFLMDTDVPENDEEGRRLTDAFTAGTWRKRLRQEIRAGRRRPARPAPVGIRPTVMHLNEGHCAFALLERARERKEEDGLRLPPGLGQHHPPDRLHHPHPVPAGHDRFSAEADEKHLGWMRDKAGLDHKGFMGLDASTWTTTASPSP